MAGLIPFNRNRNNYLTRIGNGVGFDDFYNMLDDFFNDSLPSSAGRNLLRDSFKIDIVEKETEYNIEADMPGVKKEDIELIVDGDNLCISVNQVEEENKEGKNYIHRERRSSSMSRRVRLAEAKLDEIKAKLDDGVLTVIVPKDIKTEVSRRISIE